MVTGTLNTITGGVLNDFSDILQIPAGANDLTLHVRCIHEDDKACYLENEFRATPLITMWRVTERKVYDDEEPTEEIITTYSYDGASTNTNDVSDWVDTAHTTGNGDQDLKTPRYGNFRGHSFVSTTRSDGVVTINYFHQDDYRKGTAYSTLGMTRDYHEPFEDGLAWSNYSADWERTSASKVYPDIVDGDAAVKMKNPNNTWNYLRRDTETLQDGEVLLVRFKVETGALALTLDAAGTDYLQIRFGNNASLEHYGDVDCDPTDEIAVLSSGDGNAEVDCVDALGFDYDEWYNIMFHVGDGDMRIFLWQEENPSAMQVICGDKNAPDCPIADIDGGQDWKFIAYINEGDATEGVAYIDEYNEGKIYSLTSVNQVAGTSPGVSVDQDAPGAANKDYEDAKEIIWTRTGWTAQMSFEGSGEFVGTLTDYDYDASDQGGTQYGNVTLTTISEFDPVAYAWDAHRATKRAYYPTNNGSEYIVGLPGYSNSYKCPGTTCALTEANLIAQTLFLYDDSTSYSASPTAGIRTGVRSMVCWANASEDCVDHGSHTQILYTDTAFGHDSFGNQTTVTAYDDYGNATSLWQGTAITATTTYDSDIETFPISIVNPLTHTITISYSYKLAVPTKITGVNGHVSTAAYDGFGRMTSVCRVLDDCTTTPTIQLEYFDTGSPYLYSRATQKVDASTNLNVEKYYTGLGQLVQTQILNAVLEDDACSTDADTDPDICDVLVDVDYNEEGRVVKQGLPRALDAATYSGYQDPGTWVGIEYTYSEIDDIGRTTHLFNTAGITQTTYGYSLLTNWVVNRRGYTTTTQTDVWGQTITVTQSQGPWMHFAYDSSGRMTHAYKIQENKPFAVGNYTAVEQVYDFAGRLEQQIDPDLGTWDFEYNALGQMTKQTDARDCSLNFIFDIMGRPLTKSATEAQAGDCGTKGGATTWYYDDYTDAGGFFSSYDGATTNAVGMRTGMDDDSGYTYWSYDERGQLITETKKIDSYSTAFQTTWGYNNGGQVITMTYPSGEVVTMSYLTQGVSFDVIGDGDYLTSSTYGVSGRLVERLMGASDLLTFDYSYWDWDETTGAGAMKQLQVTKTSGGNVLQDMFYGSYSTSAPGYDADGNITRIENRLDTGNVEVQTFTYDDIDRLLTAEADGGGKNPYDLETYMYDSSGRYTGISGVVTITYGTAPFHGVISTTLGHDYAYDENGTMTDRDVTEGDFDFGYDRDNRLIDVDKDSSDHFTFVYDGDGNRVKAVDEANDATTYYIGNYFEVTVEGGTPVGDYCATPSSSIPNNDTTGTSDTITISGTSGTISDLTVDVEIDHTAVGEIVVELEHEDTSTVVTLVGRPGYPPGASACRGNDIDATLDDAAASAVEDECAAGTPTISGSFSPNGSLSDFDGESLDGDWTITVKDLRSGGNTGTFESWCLDADGPTASAELEALQVVDSGADESAQTETQHPTLLILISFVQYFASLWLEHGDLRQTAIGAISNIQAKILMASDTPPAGETWKSYYYAGGQRVAMRVKDDTNDDTYFIFSDHLGSTGVTVDESGTSYSELRYKPWGDVRYESTPETPTDFTYTGQRSNTDSFGLMYYGARWYDPELGRFGSADTIVPVVNAAGYDRFAYALNNPVMYTDPTGHSPGCYSADGMNCKGPGGYGGGGGGGQTQSSYCDLMPEECGGDEPPLPDPKNPWAGDVPDDDVFIENGTDDLLLGASESPTGNTTWGNFAGCNTVADTCAEGWHPAIDSQGNNLRDPIFAFAYGTVVNVNFILGFGLYMVIEHDVYGVKYYSVYAHLDEALVTEGQVVDPSTEIAKMGGTTGMNDDGSLITGTAVHLHFEVRRANNINSNYGVGGQVWWPRTREQLDSNFVNLSRLPYVGLSDDYANMPP